MVGAPNVNALERGLDILLFLNETHTGTVAEISAGVGLPRTTTFRLLQTLARKGYVARTEWGGNYFLLSKVHSLAVGYDQSTWIVEAARPHLQALTKAILWPSVVFIPSGAFMVWYEGTDRDSPLSLKKYRFGLRLPLIQTTTGLVYLAFATQEGGLDRLPPVVRREVMEHYRTEAAFEAAMAPVRRDGFAFYMDPDWPEGMLVVPIARDGVFYACLGARYARRTIPREQALERYLAVLRGAADKIADALEPAGPAARPEAAPPASA